MQSAQSIAQPQLVFPRLILFLILLMLDFLVQLFFYPRVILSERSESKDPQEVLIIISQTEKTK
jgi:hypothetical protein